MSEDLPKFTDKIAADKDRDSRYSEEARRFLGSLDHERRSILEAKKLYHSTRLQYLSSIKEKGLSATEISESEKDDFGFLQRLFYQYGDQSKDWLFNGWILGKRSEQNIVRALSLSGDRDTARFYKTPERIRFFLQNLNLLKDMTYLNEDDREHCRSILNKYRVSLTDPANPVVLVQIDILSPSVLNYYTRSLKEENFEEKKESLYFFLSELDDADIPFGETISPADLAVSEQTVFTDEDFNEAMSGKTGICFKSGAEE